MRFKKHLSVVALLTLSIVLFMSFDDSPTGDKDEQREYEQNSPLAGKIWVQQLREPTEAGNMKFSTEYGPGIIRNASIDIYVSDGKQEKITLFDDGKNGGDEKAGDNKFSGIFRQDPDRLMEEIKRKEQQIDEKGFVLQFEGHLGKSISSKELIRFDFERFQAFEEVELQQGIIAASDCSTDILKQNSLFITDLAVVEDPVRTYNIFTGAGNPFGAWTFGTFMKNMAYESVSGINVRTFIRSWLTHWTTNAFIDGQRILNSHTGTTIPTTTRLRENEMVDNVVRPWLRNAQNNQSLSVTLANWQSLWNATQQDSILKYAPFKLTAIVNRIDLRGNSGYVSSLTNAGETRFIFSVIKTAPGSGGVPIASGTNAAKDGFNVIFEYANPHNCEGLHAYAQQWLNLSDESTTPLGSADYNDSLEVITKQVTDSGAGGLSRANQNCISQIRTNEIALANNSIFNFGEGGGINNIVPTGRWQLLQFELDATTHLLKRAPLALTPRIHANGGDEQLTNEAERNYSDVNTANDFNYLDNLSTWVNSHQNSFKRGRISYPSVYPSTTRKVLGMTAEVISNAANGRDHFWDGFNGAFGYDPLAVGLTAFPSSTAFIDTNKARHQASLNTCQGCHSAEAQTVFAHVRYLGQGVSAKYWPSFPGEQPDNTNLGGFRVEHVSPFLTGRKLRNSGGNRFNSFGDGPFASTFTDENPDMSPNPDPDDEAFDGLFYVNDAKGLVDGSNSDIWGFNDLERRKIDLCHFLNSSCGGIFAEVDHIRSTAFRLADVVQFSPFPKGSH